MSRDLGSLISWVVRPFLLTILFLAQLGCVPISHTAGLSTTALQTTIPGEKVGSPVPPNLPYPTTIPGMNTPTAPTPTADLTHTQKPGGKLYLWMYRYLDPLYASVDLATNDLPVFLEVRENPEALGADGKTVIGLAFAPYSPLVAYLTKTSESEDLWLADLNLENPELLYSIDPGWLGQSSNPGDVNIQWGPSDDSLLISSYLAQNHLILYSLNKKTAVETIGACDQIAPLPGSDQLTTWCALDKGAPSAYAYFALNGDIVFTKAKPDPGVEVYEWAFAPGDNRLAYLPKQGNLTIATNPVRSLEISARLLNEPRAFKTKPFLQWSENGERLLTYAYNQKYCPLSENPVSGNLEASECWLVADSVSGEILWGPNMNAKEIKELTGLSLEKLFSPCAGLSPNNDWLALCYQSGAVNGTILVALNDRGTAVDFGTGSLLDFKWVDN
jgi:hypothetical protein